jgi:predicted signal transduction protein with EAL and GGDEF domain
MSITRVFPKAHLIFFLAVAVAAALLCRVHVVSIASAAVCCRFITPSGKIHSFCPE